jgi:hypothetical protein
VYINSDKFFEVSKLEKPDFFDERYFQDIYEYYEYKVDFSSIENGKISINKKSKVWLNGYNHSSKICLWT